MYKEVSEELKEKVRTSNSLIAGAKLTFTPRFNNAIIYGNSEQGDDPSPDNPQEIEVIKDTLVLNNVGKNLFDAENYVKNCALENIESVTYSNDSIIIERKANSDSFLSGWYVTTPLPLKYRDSVIKIKPNTSYAFSINPSNEGCIMYYDSEFNYLSHSSWMTYGTTTTIQFTTPTNCCYILPRIGVPKTSDETEVTFTNIQLEEGSTATDYEQYQSSQITITLGDNFIAKVGDIRDVLSISSKGKVTKENKIGYLQADINKANVSKSDSVFSFNFSENVDGNHTTKALCNIAPYWKNNWSKLGCFIAWYGRPYLIVENNLYGFTADMTVDEAKAHLISLVGEKIVFYYQKLTPTEIDLGNVGTLDIFYGTNNISLDSNIETEYNVNYDSDLTITNNDFMGSLKLQDDCYNDGTILGNNIAKDLQLTIKNKNGYDLENREFKLELGIALSESGNTYTYEYVPMGNFIVDTVEDTKSNYKYNIEAFDYMSKFNKDFEDTNVYPMSMADFRHYVANFYGVEEVTQTLANDDFNIEEKPYFDNMTGREVIKAIAQINGCFVKINRDNEIEYIPLNNTSEDIEEIQAMKMNNKLDANSLYGEVNVVVLSLGGGVTGENVTRRDEESVAIYGENIIEIQDNPFVNTEARRTTAIDNLFNSLKGFKYVPTSFNYMGRFWLDTGDKIRVQNSNDLTTTYDSIVLKHYIQVPELRQSSMENEALTKTAVENQYTTTEEKKQSRTELLVDKANEKIESLVQVTNILDSQTKTNADAISTLNTTLSTQITQTAESIQAQVTSINTQIQNGEVVASATKTTSGTFDENGLTISRSDSEITTNINNVGMYVNKGSTNLLTADKDGVVTENLTVRTYFTSGYHRAEGYLDSNNKKRTGHFYVG